jgi:hypothetical protein
MKSDRPCLIQKLKIVHRLMRTGLVFAFERWRDVLVENKAIADQSAAAQMQPGSAQAVEKIVEEWIAPMPERPSANMVRMAKGFFKWTSNAWWTKELLMQHERFVILLQQREASKLSAKWEPVMVSPHLSLGRGAPASQRFANIIRNDINRRQAQHSTGMWDHVFQHRSQSPQKYHRIPTASSLHSTPSKSASLLGLGSKERGSPHTPVRSCRRDARVSPTRIFQHASTD